MPYTLDEMARDCRDALVADAGPDGREQVRQIESAIQLRRGAGEARALPANQPGRDREIEFVDQVAGE